MCALLAVAVMSTEQKEYSGIGRFPIDILHSHINVLPITQHVCLPLYSSHAEDIWHIRSTRDHRVLSLISALCGHHCSNSKINIAIAAIVLLTELSFLLNSPSHKITIYRRLPIQSWRTRKKELTIDISSVYDIASILAAQHMCTMHFENFVSHEEYRNAAGPMFCNNLWCLKCAVTKYFFKFESMWSGFFVRKKVNNIQTSSSNNDMA